MSEDRCGTYAGVSQHNRDGTPVCEPCRLANRAYMQQYRVKQDPEVKRRYLRRQGIRGEALRILASNHADELDRIMEDMIQSQRRRGVDV